MSSTFRTKLKELDGDALADVIADVNSEQKRRVPQKNPSQMEPWEFDRWSAEQIRQSEAARAAAQKGDGDV